MPAGTSYLFKEGMLSPDIRKTVSPNGEKEYYAVGVKNHFLHAVHPLAWFKKLEIEVDGRTISPDEARFVLRGQWFQVSEMVSITEVYWNLAEKAEICIPASEELAAGKHHVKLTFSMSMLEDTQVMDTKGLWPLRVEFVEDDLELEVRE